MNPWDTTDLAHLDFDSNTFCGTARLFPLPNLVLYPHVMQPLHIFEERYREMLEDALADDRLIAMTLLEPGWEDEYDSRPPIDQYACLGKVVAQRRLDDGRYNVLLLGVGRVRIVRELEPLRSFRRAKVELVEDCYDFSTDDEAEQLQEALVGAFRKHLPCACQVPEQLEDLLSRHLSLGLLTDLAAYALPLDLAIKRQLLAESRVSVRAETLLSQIEQGLVRQPVAAKALGFPPAFSDN
ncbi:MAG: LON peptidase substrate-binding domain-containing protein [Pirellulales bacterium]